MLTPTINHTKMLFDKYFTVYPTTLKKEEEDEDADNIVSQLVSFGASY